MSVTFFGHTSNNHDPVGGIDESPACCMCAQCSPAWRHPFTADVDVDQLSADANPNCPHCFGLGIEYPGVPKHFFDLSNITAKRFFAAWAPGLRAEYGELSVDRAQALIDAMRQNIAERLYERDATDPVTFKRGPKGARIIALSRTTADMIELFERFQGFVDACAALGATSLRWS